MNPTPVAWTSGITVLTLIFLGFYIPYATVIVPLAVLAPLDFAAVLMALQTTFALTALLHRRWDR